MKTTKKLLALLLALVMVASVLAGCGGETSTDEGANNGDSKYGGHLNVCIKSRPTSVDPVKATNSWNRQWATCIYEPFLTRDAENEIRPCVCDYELSEDQTDLKLWPREGYVFSGGYGQVDIYDIEASFNRGLKMQSGVYKYVMPNVASVTVENDGEKDYLHVVFSAYNEMNMYYLASNISWWPAMPKEICEKYASTNIMAQIEDAVGTGPYVVTELQDSVQITLTKRDDYVPVDNSMYTGAAGTKYGYMDTMTFWFNGTDASAAMAVMAGDYDMTEAIPVDYKAMAEEAGITLSVMPSDQRTWVYFNTVGNTLCAKYPALRKAVMAAIDYESFLSVITDSSQRFDQNIIVGDKYNTDAFTKQDYYGPASQEVVDKYLNEARAAGYKDEPLQLVLSTGRTDIPNMFRKALDESGINYEMKLQEPAVASAFQGDPSNNWDFYFGWGVSAYTPSLLSDALVVDLFANEEKDQILEEMRKIDPNSEEYMALWDRLATLTAEGCYIGYMSAIDWWWWHPDTLNINNDEGLVRFHYNTYWDDPQNHPKKS